MPAIKTLSCFLLFDEFIPYYNRGGVNRLAHLDIHGIITYANRRFRKLSGYSKDELIGLPNIAHRHPDMPEALFKAMWKIVSEKKIWRGYVKSMTKE
ncbi:MAG: PAS domain-containing protein [Epsilonproteobacteria bacterium]|nr:PAS domain-containing protein [Campylobacterota bacterium]